MYQNEKEQERVLIFAPHMDDELIGCGGSILKHIARGRSVAIVYFTDGSHFVTDNSLAEKLRRSRHEEADSVCQQLGIKAYYLNIPDRKLIYTNEVLGEIVEILQRFQPDIIYIPHRNEGDREHRLVHELFCEAYWLAADTFQLLNNDCMNGATYILEYEVWTPIEKPNYYENIEEFIEDKCSLISQYQSQMKFFNYAHAIKGLNQYRGGMSQSDYAEAFIMRNEKYNLFSE